jgi:hypothetical protein
MATKEVKFFGDYNLRYGWQGLEALSTALDAPAFADFDKILNELGPAHLRIILWAGLLHKYPTMGVNSPEMFQVMDDYLEDHSLEDLGNVVGQALMASGIIGQQEADKGEEVQKPKLQKQLKK